MFDNELVKLSDFGTCKIQALNPRQTNAENLGTFFYKPPETMEDKSVWTMKSDIYSLGLTLYEIATQTLAFRGCSSVDDVKAKVLAQERPQFPPQPFQMNEAFKVIIERCWAHNPDERLSTQDILAKFADAGY